MPATLIKKSSKPDRLPSCSEQDDDLEEIFYDSKKKIECICPKCGQKHKMTLHWIGRGVPRKYCALCKSGS